MCMNVCMCMCMCIYMYVCTVVCMYVCVCNVGLARNNYNNKLCVCDVIQN